MDLFLGKQEILACVGQSSILTTRQLIVSSLKFWISVLWRRKKR